MDKKKRRSPSKKAAKRPDRGVRRGSKASAKDRDIRRRSAIIDRYDDEEMLSEFSDDTNTFYVDENKERKARRAEERSQKKERKKAEKRKPMSPTQRKVIRIISYAAIITVVLIVGIVLSLTVLFKTQNYEVTGCTKYSESEIIEACGISKGQNIFLAPKRPAEKRIKDKYAYIEEAHVGFRIPETIKISIIEAVEGYLVKVSDQEYLVISTKGRILDKITDKGSNNLPIFIGPKPLTGEVGEYVSYEDESVVNMIASITQTFADNGYQGITEIDATDTADISFTYDNRIKVKLGIPEELDYKIRTAMTIIDENLDKNMTGTIQGILDVSRCNSTRRSYFNETQIYETQPATQDPSQPSTEAATDAVTDNGVSDGNSSDSGAVSDSGVTDDYSWYSADGYSADNGADIQYDYYDENGYGYFW